MSSGALCAIFMALLKQVSSRQRGQTFTLRHDQQSLVEVLKRLNATSSERLMDQWLGHFSSADLQPVEKTKVLDLLVDFKIGGKRDLTKQLKNYEAEQRARLAEQFEEKNQDPREQLVFDSTQMQLMAKRVEAIINVAPGDYEMLVFAGQYVRIDQIEVEGFDALDDPMTKPPKASAFSVYDKTAMKFRIEQSVRLQRYVEGRAKNIPVPPDLVTDMLDNPQKSAPRVVGLVPHPIILKDGRLVNKEGRDPTSELYLSFGGAQFKSPSDKPTRSELNEAIVIIDALFEEFEFEDSELDRAGAFAYLFTALQRRLIDMAPGFIVGASLQGSGKTTLARIVHIVSTGQDMPVCSLSGNAEETGKQLLAILMSGASHICFDNLPDGCEINDPVLAAALTSPTYEGRILGMSKTVRVSTKATIVLTGNNIALAPDMVRRLLPISLTPRAERPERRTFKVKDVFSHSLDQRSDVIWAVHTIVRHHILSTQQKLPEEASGYPSWDHFVREPLLAAGLPDVIDLFERNREVSPEIAAKGAIVSSLHTLVGDVELSASDILSLASSFELSGPAKIAFDANWPLPTTPNDDDFSRGLSSNAHYSNPQASEHIENLNVALNIINGRATTSTKSLGRALRKVEGFVSGEYQLVRRMVNNSAKYRVMPISKI